MASQPIIFSKLSDDQAHQTAQYHSSRGASVVVTPDGPDTFTVRVTYSASNPSGAQTNGKSDPGGSTGSLWQQLVAQYSGYRGASDSLKVASLAQWIQESGSGTSPLAMQHLNFGGIKYRDRMAGFATQVAYTGTDGETTSYCKFASLGAFIDGYWHFIQTGPYAGWQRFSNDDAGFINFIAPNYSADPHYADNVAKLFDRARGLLSLAVAPGPSGGPTKPAQPEWTDLTAKFLNKRSSPIQGIVLHDTAGSGTHNDTLYLRNPQDGRKVSVDFTVEKDGSIWKLNPDLPSFYCNHAGRSTSWMGFKNRQVNAVSIGIEIVQFDNLKGPPFYPAAQVQAVAQLCAWLGMEYGFDNSRITTHHQVITDGSRSDPRKFPFDDFWAAYWNTLGQGAHFRNALAGHEEGDDSGAGDFETSTDES